MRPKITKIIENCLSLHEDYETEYLDIFGELDIQVRATKLYSEVLLNIR